MGALGCCIWQDMLLALDNPIHILGEVTSTNMSFHGSYQAVGRGLVEFGRRFGVRGSGACSMNELFVV